MEEPLISSLRRALASSPDDIPLQLLLGRLLFTAGSSAEAVSLAAGVLQREPGNTDARQLMTDALTGLPAEHVRAPVTEPSVTEQWVAEAPAARAPAGPEPTDEATAETSEPENDVATGVDAAADTDPTEFDWSAAENDVHELAQPMFVDATPTVAPGSGFDIERSVITLADVGGMTAVKNRLNAAFLAPLSNPELRKLYAKSLKGGLLMYGPPGCGKTFIARAIAGELGARFLTVGLADILDPMLGNSEQNVHEAFELARREAPCVIFFDEIDALGQRRSQTRNSALRGTVNQLLTELDGVADQNEGVFVLAATNQPWDVDPALRRPGRFDRTVLVLPPDEEARESIFRYHLQHRPVEGIELKPLARASAGLSGADIAYVCEVAAERALMDSATTGSLRLIGMTDVTDALAEVSPSTSSWLDSARNVVLFGDDDGTYTELKAYLKKARRL
ncbi:ATP-binding protein [Subtercola boreus]|uniref:AAA family ATPase n=1 Tax=Subtercola boreus TaxID=120213 RepID=A0A3E0WBK5_9MICO|nr:ATP-binding protein [Subtercola boreus]RFA21778.1 AAA family ATPase [Subtercola boreus]RFA21890.1 AAA family ATPase [Subtercola boreus]RFA27837.1 AAA family ATPase [Subtercola boreus]